MRISGYKEEVMKILSNTINQLDSFAKFSVFSLRVGYFIGIQALEIKASICLHWKGGVIRDG